MSVNVAEALKATEEALSHGLKTPVVAKQVRHTSYYHSGAIALEVQYLIYPQGWQGDSPEQDLYEFMKYGQEPKDNLNLDQARRLFEKAQQVYLSKLEEGGCKCSVGVVDCNCEVTESLRKEDLRREQAESVGP